MRWLAIRFPCLPLEVSVLDAEAAASPWAVTERLPEGCRLVLVNAHAAAAGVRPGLSPEAARALMQGLRLVARDPDRESRALEGLASWALQFSAQIHLSTPDVLLVEVAGSRRLFGSGKALLQRVREALDALGFQACLVLAPTPKAALLLARAGRNGEVVGFPELQHAVKMIPVDMLPLARDQQEGLKAAGLCHCGDLLALPGAALGRRLGAEFLDWWLRLSGQAPDPLVLFRPPDVFIQEVELPVATETQEGLLFSARRLLLILEGYLRARQMVAARLAWSLIHEEMPPTRFTMGFQAPLRQASVVLPLLREQLSRVALAAPVVRLVLQTRELLAWDGETDSLLKDGIRLSGNAFLDRLRARLGDQAVSGLRLAADHRPERSMQLCSPGESGGKLGFPERPQWLLSRPRELEVRSGRPWWHGPLELEGERERIEAGWWDSCPVRRDYFVAHADNGVRMWVFIDRERGNRWFLHGFFG